MEELRRKKKKFSQDSGVLTEIRTDDLPNAIASGPKYSVRDSVLNPIVQMDYN
jgi:hypothetical protein